MHFITYLQTTIERYARKSKSETFLSYSLSMLVFHYSEGNDFIGKFNVSSDVTLEKSNMYWMNHLLLNNILEKNHFFSV